MFKNFLFNLILNTIKAKISDGSLGELLSKLLNDLLSNGKLAITIDGTPSNDGLKDFFVQFLTSFLQQALASGKLNDLLIKLLGGLLGTKSLSLPVSASAVTGLSISGDILAVVYEDGTVNSISL